MAFVCGQIPYTSRRSGKPIIANVRVIMFNLISSLLLFAYITNSYATDYQYHQMWSYKTRSGEEESEILINYIDSTEKYGYVYHITVFNVKVKTGKKDNRIIKIIPYLAVSKETLDKSVIKLTATRYPYMKFIDGYRKWKSNLEAGNEVVYKDSIANILNNLESHYYGNQPLQRELHLEDKKP